MSDDGETLLAFEDARRGGVGFVRILRITTESYRVARIDPALVLVIEDSTAYLDRLRGLILTIPCAYCSAAPGARCRTVSGAAMSTFHVARSGPVYDVWRLGHRDGLVDAFRRLTNDWETPDVELLRRHGVTW